MNNDNFLPIILTIILPLSPIILSIITIIIRRVIPNKYDILNFDLIDINREIEKKIIYLGSAIPIFHIVFTIFNCPKIRILFNIVLLLYITYISISIALDINISIKKNLKLAITSSIFFTILFWLSGSFFYEINNNLIFGITGYSADNFPLASNLLLCNDMLMVLASILWPFISYIAIRKAFFSFKETEIGTQVRSYFTILTMLFLTSYIYFFIFEDTISTHTKYPRLVEKILLYTFILPEDYLNGIPNKSIRSKGYYNIIYNLKSGEKLHILNNGNVLVYKPPYKRGIKRFYTIKVNHLPYKVSYSRINPKTGQLQILK
ncbi:MAG: hypothetical protein ACI8TE_000476 [Francisella sp.]|jgi:hypothetical protein